ncbi:hypothetical protein [Roseicyclus mahoneyensis]|nr:hypothetical protein [Roseicyclus mahoneyensis]
MAEPIAVVKDRTEPEFHRDIDAVGLFMACLIMIIGMFLGLCLGYLIWGIVR